MSKMYYRNKVLPKMQVSKEDEFWMMIKLEDFCFSVSPVIAGPCSSPLSYCSRSATCRKWMWSCVWKLLELSVSPPRITDLLLQSPSARLTAAFSLSLIRYVTSGWLNSANNPLTVLHCCLCRALLRHTSQTALTGGISQSLWATKPSESRKSGVR